MRSPAGRHGAPAVRRSVRVLPLLAYGVGVLASAAAWVVLVRAAIHFGTEARGGESIGWAFLALTAFGAVCCLLLMLVLVGRLLIATGVKSDYRPRRALDRR